MPEIREYRTSDQSETVNLLKEIYGDDPVAINYFFYREPVDENCLTLVSTDKNQLTGIGSIWKNKYHPFISYLSINILPAYQGQGLGSRTFQELNKAADSPKKFQTSLWSNNLKGFSFLKKHNFKIVRKTFMPVLKITGLPEIKIEQDCMGSFSIISFDSVNSTDIEKVVDLYREIYQTNHLVNPALHTGLEHWQKILFSPDLIRAGCFAAFDGKEFIGLSIMYKGENEDTAELGIRGVKPGFLNLNRKVIINLTKKQLKYAWDNNYLYITGEFDNTDRAFEVMSGFINFEKEISWDTYQLEPLKKGIENYERRRI